MGRFHNGCTSRCALFAALTYLFRITVTRTLFRSGAQLFVRTTTSRVARSSAQGAAFQAQRLSGTLPYAARNRDAARRASRILSDYSNIATISSAIFLAPNAARALETSTTDDPSRSIAAYYALIKSNHSEAAMCMCVDPTPAKFAYMDDQRRDAGIALIDICVTSYDQRNGFASVYCEVLTRPRWMGRDDKYKDRWASDFDLLKLEDGWLITGQDGRKIG